MNERNTIRCVQRVTSNFLNKYVILAAMLCTFSMVSAQNGDLNVTGVVLAESNGEPLIGASIIVKGSRLTAVTGLNGEFSLRVKIGDKMNVSYLGYITQEVIVSENKLNIRLKENEKALSEVVKIGYGSISRKDVTGSISSISGDEIRKSQTTTIEQALQGKIPGMVVQQISGQPGGAVSVQIHGLSSFSGSSPLWIVDGIKMNGGATLEGNKVNPIAGINSSDIESIDVLKDASSTAIYGSDATNGVIVVTTKRGKIAPPTVSYDFYTGYQQLMSKVPVMNLQEFATFVNERNAGIGWGFDSRPEFANPQYLGKGTDWQDVLFRDAPMSSHTLSLRGGDVRTTYFLSASYLKQEGIALGSDYAKTSVRLNLDNKTTDWLKIGTDIQLVNINENINSSSSNVIQTALSQTPDIAVQNNDGSWGGAYNTNGWVQQVANPYALALINKDKANRNQFWGSAYAEIKFSKDLSLKNEISGGFSMATEDKFSPTYEMGLMERTVNSAEYSFSQSVSVKASSYLTYNHLFSDIYNTNVLIGHETQFSQGEGVYAYRENFPSNSVQVISSGDATTAKNSGTKTESAMESYFGRINLGMNDKYLFTINVREDGSSKYALANRWVTNYSAAGAWRISKEKLVKDIRSINDLKLRVGYGLTNNPGGRDFAYTTVLTTVANSLSGVSQLTSKLGNPDLEWEQTKNANIGLDATFLNSRLNFFVDFYNRRTDGMIMQTYLPDYSATSIGYSPGAIDAPYVNIGSVSNKGFDFKISSKNIEGKNFSWSSDLTVSHNVNKVLKLNADDAAIYGTYSKTVVGRSIGEFYGYVFDGIYSKASDFLGDAELGIEPHARPVRNGEELPVGTASGSIWYGDRMFKDLNGDDIIDERDQTYLGSPLPKVQLGLNNSFSYKHFDMNIFFSANIGNKVFNQLRINGESTSGSYGYMKILKEHAQLALIDPNGSETDVRNVYVTNPDTRIVGVRNDNTNGNDRTSDIYVEDGSFIKCKTISLGYTFSDHLLRKTPIKSLRIYANVTNVFTITKYTGLDPEIGSWDPVNAGVDSGFYPQSRVFTLGLNISLNK
jgi:TonB-dependent starch-binding outer membrane protein SusC